MLIFKKRRIYIIAEIASAHEGNYSKLKKLIYCAKKSDADFVKLQIFNLESFISKNSKKYKIFKKLSFNEKQWKRILNYVKKINIKLIIEVFDEKSSEFIKQFDHISAIKIPSFEFDNSIFLKKIRKKFSNIILGVGGLNKKQINNIILLTKKNKFKETVLMHGFQKYPTKIEESNINKINFLKKFNKIIGYADHSSASNYFSNNALCFLAIGAGARVIEKHITLDRSKKGNDYYSALNPNEFKHFVRTIKEIESSFINSSNSKISIYEKKYLSENRRYAVAREEICSQDKLTLNKVSFKRISEKGLSIEDISKVLSKKVKNKKKKDDPYTLNDF